MIRSSVMTRGSSGPGSDERARARSLELGIIRHFDAEDEEVSYLANSARHRRHLSDPQKIAIGRAYDEHFRRGAKERQIEGASKGGSKLPADLREALPDSPAEGKPKKDRSRQTTAQTAAVLGMSERKYQQGKHVEAHAPPEIKAAWERFVLSTFSARLDDIQALIQSCFVNVLAWWTG